MRSFRFLPIALLVLAYTARADPSVTAVASSSASSLALDGEGNNTPRIVKVADVTIVAAGSHGYTLRVTPTTLAKGDGVDPIGYQVVSVDSNAPAPDASAFTAAANAEQVFVDGAPGSFVRAIYIRYTARSLQDPGTYLSSLNITATDN